MCMQCLSPCASVMMPRLHACMHVMPTTTLPPFLGLQSLHALNEMQHKAARGAAPSRRVHAARWPAPGALRMRAPAGGIAAGKRSDHAACLGVFHIACMGSGSHQRLQNDRRRTEREACALALMCWAARSPPWQSRPAAARAGAGAACPRRHWAARRTWHAALLLRCCCWRPRSVPLTNSCAGRQRPAPCGALPPSCPPRMLAAAAMHWDGCEAHTLCEEADDLEGHVSP